MIAAVKDLSAEQRRRLDPAIAAAARKGEVLGAAAALESRLRPIAPPP
jgi:hypothetical protein